MASFRPTNRERVDADRFERWLAGFGLKRYEDAKPVPERETHSKWVMHYVDSHGRVVARETIDKFNGDTIYSVMH